MAISVAEEVGREQAEIGETRAHILDDCLELEALTPAQIRVLRTWVTLVNGTIYAQPFLVEDGPGRFRLYVGPAAERVRTSKGVA